jgi:acyl-coenzyme A thioesterase PaaI-like protein
MNYKDRVLQRIQPLLDHHLYFQVEFGESSFRIVMANRTPNILGNFAGGDMAYAANAAAGVLCLAEGHLSQTASINTECVARGDGELLVADAKIVHLGSKLIRLRSDVYVRSGGKEKLVAIAQVNMSRMSDKALKEMFEK